MKESLGDTCLTTRLAQKAASEDVVNTTHLFYVPHASDLGAMLVFGVGASESLITIGEEHDTIACLLKNLGMNFRYDFIPGQHGLLYP